jgi:hypothetical protein
MEEPMNTKRLHRALSIAVLLGALVALGHAVDSAEAATFTVTSSADSYGSCPSKPLEPSLRPGCTLRSAIMQVNAQPAGTGPHRINFSIGYGNVSIDVNNTGLGPLPKITQPVFIDGQSQQRAVKCGPGFPGFPGCQNFVPCVVPCVVINGTGVAGNSNGLELSFGSSGSTVRNLVINNFLLGTGIRVQSSSNFIQGNYIGTDATGTFKQTSKMDNGVLIIGGAGYNTVGGTGVRNVISGNKQGVVIDATGLTDPFVFMASRTFNQVLGNYIGTNAAASGVLGNDLYGVYIKDASANTVGGGNVIGGNDVGVKVATTGAIPMRTNQVKDNFIGTAANGTTELQNGHDGINILGMVDSTTVQGNLVKFNLVRGIKIGSGSTMNYVQNNTSLESGVRDMEDENTTCVNTWYMNVFETLYDASYAASGIYCIN